MYRTEQLIKDGELFYTIDQVDETKLISLYKLDEQSTESVSRIVESEVNVVLEIKSKLLFNESIEGILGEIIEIMQKKDFDTYAKGKIPEFSILREENISLKYDLLNLNNNPELAKYKLRQTIWEYSKNKKVLNMFPGISDLSIAALNGGATHVVEFSNYVHKEQSTFLKDLNDIDSSKIQSVAGNYEEALEFLEDPFQRFELIIMDLSVLEKSFPDDLTKFREEHKDRVRELQHRTLEQKGFIVLVSNDLTWHLDNYIRPGADRLTKYLSGKEYGELKMFNAYAFYK